MFELVEHFLPHTAYSLSGCLPVEHEIRCLVSEQLCIEVSSIVQEFEPTFKVETFVDDPEMVCWEWPELRIWLVEPLYHSAKFVIIQEPVRNRVTLVLSNPNVKTQIMRVLRELYLRELEAHGGILLHGGGFVKDEEVTLIVADKCCGKTTAMLTGLLISEMEYLANDRVLVVQDGEGLAVLPFPMAIRVGWGTARAFPNLHVPDLSTLYRPQDPRLAGETSEAATFGSGIKLELTPLEISQFMRVPHSGGGKLKRILVPAIQKTGSGVKMTKLNHQQALDELSGQVMTPIDEKWCNPWLLPRQVCSEAVREMLERIVQNADVFRVAYGFGDVDELRQNLRNDVRRAEELSGLLSHG
ncbi:hypothetical protein [Labrenzia sp. DG1229]|uniref:hypothetical protein n=1 Tax=Labrenzia sp. DG1229 TaxID=681847 RepID=UPI0012EC24E7|nr:hypothetical protein [Labrenzia sp. DG1229]